MEMVEAWLSIPIVQLCGVLFLALGIILVVRALKGKPSRGDK